MKEVIVAVLKHGSKILILKRSQEKTFDPNRWEFVSGFVKKGDLKNFAIEQVLLETGIDGEIVKIGADFEAYDRYGKWLIHPFLFETDKKEVILSVAHTEYKWISPYELKNYETVKDLNRNLKSLGIRF